MLIEQFRYVNKYLVPVFTVIPRVACYHWYHHTKELSKENMLITESLQTNVDVRCGIFWHKLQIVIAFEKIHFILLLDLVINDCVTSALFLIFKRLS